MNQSLEMTKIAYQALEEKLAEEIKVLDIRQISVIADYFIIANGKTWVLIDFGDIVIHIFDQENRLFYDLERIWKDGVEVSMETGV